MDIAPQIFNAKVMHKRLFPKVNQFTYKIYNLVLPLPANAAANAGLWFKVNKPAISNFYDKDHGKRDGSRVQDWAVDILRQYDLQDVAQDIMLITMPRVLGYVFNPVSFYLCLDNNRQLRAVICEVHNTFGEQHSYVCFHEDKRAIHADDWLAGDKVFHVSPFLERSGSYRFRFAMQQEKLGIWIDHYNKEDNKQLLTSLTGSLAPLTRQNMRRAFFSCPLVSLKAISLIHIQALKLTAKGIRYIAKPQQIQPQASAASKLTKM